MFVYYKVYREPFSPTISTRRCGDKGKNGSPWSWGCAQEDKKRSYFCFIYIYFFRTNVLLFWPVDRSLLLHQQARD